MSAAQPTRDRFTFQYAELKRGNAPAQALAKIALEFLHTYSDSPHYEVLLSAFVERLAESDDAQCEEAWRNLSASLVERQHSLLEEERKREQRPKKWAPNKPVKDIINDSSDDEAAELTPEEIERREKEKEEAERAKEEEWRRIQEHMEKLERQKAENEARLAAKARQVDTKAFEEKVKQEGIVLLNPGDTKGKKGGGKGGKEQALSAEEVGKLHQEVAEVMREKESLKTVLSTSDDELPAKIEDAKKELAKVEAEAKAMGKLENKKAKEMAKGQITQLQQKLSKQTLERNRIALQVKALDPNPQRDELVELLTQADKIAVSIELSQ